MVVFGGVYKWQTMCLTCAWDPNMLEHSYLLNSVEPLEESATLRVDADMQVPISYSPEVRPDSPVVDGHATQLGFCNFG